MFTNSGPYGMWHRQYLLKRHGGESSHKFPVHSPGGFTLQNFAFVHGLCTESVSDDDMWGAAIGRSPAASCNIKARAEVCCLRLPYYGRPM